jgi:alkylation response protein AidB-like acyl-CoA dehydrogenase
MSGAGWSSRWANQGGLNTRSGLQNTQARPAEMATGVDSLALLTYCPAWISDRGRRVTVEAAMAKMLAPETAQRGIDAAVQIFGGLGLRSMSAKVSRRRSRLSLGSDRTKNAIRVANQLRVGSHYLGE